ncbi:MAG: hypothetical protein K6U03_07215, partial [Firmicutes bacterium]|nr:hypothetical protein [Bacillota bacterium]
ILWRARLRPEDLPPGDPMLFRFAHPDDAGILWRLHQGEDPRFAREEELFRHLLPGGEGERAILVLRGGKPVAYAFLVFRPEAPSVAAVLEYAGERLTLASALRSVAHRLGLGELEIFVPFTDRELLLRLRAAGGDWRVAPMPGAIAILDPEGLWTDLAPHFARRLGEATWRRLSASSYEGGAFGLRLGEEAISLPDPGRLVGLLFGEGEEAWSGSLLPPGLRRTLALCLPLPLPWERRWAGPVP